MRGLLAARPRRARFPASKVQSPKDLRQRISLAALFVQARQRAIPEPDFRIIPIPKTDFERSHASTHSSLLDTGLWAELGLASSRYKL
jgi:hypothetical protein